MTQVLTYSEFAIGPTDKRLAPPFHHVKRMIGAAARSGSL
jgi:hypothetical protein